MVVESAIFWNRARLVRGSNEQFAQVVSPDPSRLSPKRKPCDGGVVHKCHIALAKTRSGGPWHVDCYGSVKRPPVRAAMEGMFSNRDEIGGGFLIGVIAAGPNLFRERDQRVNENKGQTRS